MMTVPSRVESWLYARLNKRLFKTLGYESKDKVESNDDDLFCLKFQYLKTTAIQISLIPIAYMVAVAGIFNKFMTKTSYTI